MVNEAIETKWNPKTKSWDAFYKPCPWLDIIGPEYIEIAYKAAHEADPDTQKLLYNEWIKKIRFCAKHDQRLQKKRDIPMG